jgi:ketosteroid isomerase-like protein
MTTLSAPEVFQVVDALDAARFAELCTPNAVLHFGNAPALVGTEAIVAGISGFFTTIAGMRHTVHQSWTVGDEHGAELAVSYDRLDGEEVTIPCVSLWTTDAAGLITRYRVFFDLAPVFA